MAPHEQAVESAPRTRRALLTAGLGAAAATAATALGRPAPTRGANGDPILVGQTVTGSARTLINMTAVTDQVTFWSESSGATGGTGLLGQSLGDEGVGVVGTAQGAGATKGVVGIVTSPDGIGVDARNTQGGVALRAAGSIRYSWSGKATIGAGKAKEVVAFPGVDSTSLIFVVLANSRASRWVRAVVPSSGYFTIYLNGTVGKNTKASWFILDRWA